MRCRLQANAGALTNYEVLEFLRGRGATSDPMGCLGAVAPSECKVRSDVLGCEFSKPVNIASVVE